MSDMKRVNVMKTAMVHENKQKGGIFLIDTKGKINFLSSHEEFKGLEAYIGNYIKIYVTKDENTLGYCKISIDGIILDIYINNLRMNLSAKIASMIKETAMGKDTKYLANRLFNMDKSFNRWLEAKTYESYTEYNEFKIVIDALSESNTLDQLRYRIIMMYLFLAYSKKD